MVAWDLARATGAQARSLVPVVMFNNSGNMGMPLALAFPLAWAMGLQGEARAQLILFGALCPVSCVLCPVPCALCPVPCPLP